MIIKIEKIKYSLPIITVLTLGMMLSIFSCSPFSKKETVHTKLSLSNGLRIKGKIYFIASYLLYKPSKTVIPMYMATPRKIFYKNIFLYSIDEGTCVLRQVSKIVPVCDTQRESDVKNSWFVFDAPVIIFSFQSAFQKETQKLYQEIFMFNITNGSLQAIQGKQYRFYLKKYFTFNKYSPSDNPNIISFSHIKTLIANKSLTMWNLPSPLVYDQNTPPIQVQMLIKGKGDRFYRDAVLQKTGREFSLAEIKGIMESMKKYKNQIPSSSLYHSYYEEWSIKIKMTYIQKSGKMNQASKIKLLAAAYFNDTKMVLSLLNKKYNINQADELGRTALMYSVFGNAPDTMKILMRRGADLKKETQSGWTVWMFVSTTPLRQLFLDLKEERKK